MKKYFFVAFIIISSAILFTACGNKTASCDLTDVNITASATEITNIQNYLTANSLTATQHPSGFFYKVNQVGTGAVVSNLCTNVTVRYTGRLTNGVKFDTTAAVTPVTFELGNLITGWQKGLPLISTGGKITLYIPPSLGYGNAPAGTVPANSILIFDIELVSVS